jgi:hypothetical protein
MTNKEQDPNLQANQEANTTKHINFLELEDNDNSSSVSDSSNDDDSPTKKAWREMREAKKNESEKEK